MACARWSAWLDEPSRPRVLVAPLRLPGTGQVGRDLLGRATGAEQLATLFPGRDALRLVLADRLQRLLGEAMVEHQPEPNATLALDGADHDESNAAEHAGGHHVGNSVQLNVHATAPSQNCSRNGVYHAL